MAATSVEILAGKQDGDRILRFDGPMTLSCVFDIQPVLREDFAGGTILDLSQVPYLDSAAVGMLVAFHVSCQRQGRRYAITNLAERIQKMLAICQVDRILTILPTVQAAEQQFQAACK